MSDRVLDSNLGDADIDALFDGIVAENPQLNAQIEQVRNSNNAYLCEVLRVYPYEDKALVRILNNDERVFCRLSHEVLGGGMCIDYLPLGVEKIDGNYLKDKSYIQPFDNLYGVMIKVRWLNKSDENVLFGYVNVYDKDNLKSSNNKGEISIKNGQSKLSVTNERVNIITPAFFINGLPYDEPELKNYYDKDEMNLIIDSMTKDTSIYDELLEVIDNYKLTSNDKYTLFRGDCWSINNNYESSAAITSTNESNFTVTGTFRTYQDMVGLYWYSDDLITHPYISYGSRHNYKGVKLEFNYEMSGCKNFNFSDLNNHPPSLTIALDNNEVYYFNMCDFVNGNKVVIDFDNLIKTAGTEYLDSEGNTITIPDGETLKVDVSKVKYIMMVLIPTNYSPANQYTIMDNVNFSCKITNIKVTNGYICNEHIKLNPHQFRICEGYDDFYNLNPYRICKEMRKLGYTKWCDLYIGASHFYEKIANPNNTNNIINVSNFDHVRTEKMVLDTSKPLNIAFKKWLDCYSRELKKNDCSNLVISVSMENLQCPSDWRQKANQGNSDNVEGYAITGWIPSTFFYSPCHEAPIEYMKKVSEACLDIVVANGMQPILQLGEAWWWWNEGYKPKDSNGKPINVENWQPPCFYDEATKTKYRKEFGHDMPVYTTSWSEFDEETIDWLNKQIVNYSWKLREVVKKSKYENGLYLALFFPPSVMDEDRVPPMMQRVNYLSGIYNPSQLDILQIEDYDWVTGNPFEPETKEMDRSHHPRAYTIGQELGFPLDRLHYFGGFVQYPEDAGEFWKEIKKAMNTAINKGFAEVYVWAGSQVRRDGKMLGYDAYELIQKLINLKKN